jgi:putative DNA primase/helicase
MSLYLKPLEKKQPVVQPPLGPVHSAKQHGSFSLRRDGVYQTKKTKQGNAYDQYICSPIEVVAQSRDENGQEWGYVLQWKDRDGRLHNWSVPASLLVKNGTDLVEALAKGGLKIAPRAKGQLKDYISAVNPSDKVLNVSRPGWYKSQSGPRVFVMPNTVVGAGQDNGVVLQQDSYDPSAQKTGGSLDDWKTDIAGLCAGNDILTFSVSVAFAAPTLELLGKDSGGFHLYGLSSSGKSTALHVATSVWGYPVQTWRTTDNALEDTAERHNDLLLPLDELSQVDPKKAAEVAYMLGNGEGKHRLNQSIIPQKKKTWRLLFLSTGEITLADHVQTAGKKIKAGTEVRMVNIDADAGGNMGVFGNTHGASDAAVFADSLKDAAGKYCAAAGPAFVEWLIKNENDAVGKLRDMIAEFKVKHVSDGSSGEIYRVADRFALVGAAGELATKAGITGWEQGQAMKAALWAFQAWLSKRSIGSSDLEKAVDQVRAFLLANPDRFERLHEDNVGLDAASIRPVVKRVGFKQPVSDDGEKRYEYLVTADAFKNEVCQGQDATKVAQELHKRGYLRRGKNRLQVQVRVPDLGSVRCYAIQTAIFDEADETSSARSGVGVTGHGK